VYDIMGTAELGLVNVESLLQDKIMQIKARIEM
jgi:hypothetical protein